LVNVRAAVLAERLGFTLDAWEEGGMGAATGFMCRLGDGLETYTEEFAHAVKHLKAQGPTFYVPAEALRARGVAATVSAILSAVGLAESNVDWRQSDAFVQTFLADRIKP
jgi:ABC-type sulfate transport system substrate-binding protein